MSILEEYQIDFESNVLLNQVELYFETFGKTDVFKHTLEVVDELRKLNERFDFDYETCEVVCLLHDVGRVVSKDQIVDLCQEYGYEISTGEKNIPSLLHQIASRIISQQVFGISNESILSAVDVHTFRIERRFEVLSSMVRSSILLLHQRTISTSSF